MRNFVGYLMTDLKDGKEIFIMQLIFVWHILRSEMWVSFWSSFLGRRWSLLRPVHHRYHIMNIDQNFPFKLERKFFISWQYLGPCSEGDFLHPGQEVQTRVLRVDPHRRTLHQFQVSCQSYEAPFIIFSSSFLSSHTMQSGSRDYLWFV